MKKFVVALFLVSSTFLAWGAPQAKLLDKTLAVIDDQVFTLSMVKRVMASLAVRRNISGMIYSKTDYSQAEIVEIQMRKILIRSKLSELGYVISDDQVESQVKETEQRLGLKREQLLQFLSTNNFTFDEYFELVRESIEFNLFITRVIQPLISVTEQEIKNAYFRKNVDNKALNFRYNLVDFSLAKKDYKNFAKDEMKEALVRYQADGHLSEKMRNLDTTDLGDVAEDGLAANVREQLKKTDEGAFTEVVLINDRHHVFFLKKKDLVESERYLKEKEQIKDQLFEELSRKMLDVWTQREKNKHYIRNF